MKKIIALALVLLAGTVLANASSLISKQTAENDALAAVGGGTVTLAVQEKELGKIIWSVDVTGTTNEYEVWVDAHTGSILQILTQPLALVSSTTKAQAESIALAAVGGGTVVSAQRDQWKGYQIWDVAINQPGLEYDVYVNVSGGAVLNIIKTVNKAGVAATYISKATAESIALAAVGGGTVLLATLETNDKPVDWSVDVKTTSGVEYEVKINAITSKVIAIIKG